MIGGDQILSQKRFRKPIFTILKINELQNNFLQNYRKPDNQRVTTIQVVKTK